MFCVILLSYKRPGNIKGIVDVLLGLSRVSKVVISNNNPEINLVEWLSESILGSDKVDLLQQVSAKDCAYRFELAKEYSADYDNFICPDDDIFLSVRQYELLMDAYLKDRSRVYGVRGQLLMHAESGPFLHSGLSEVNSFLDVLNCLYVFSNQHVNRYFQLVKQLGWADDGLRFVDDVLISLASSLPPRCLNVGELSFCDTQDHEDIATWQSSGFASRRIEAFFQIKSLTFK